MIIEITLSGFLFLFILVLNVLMAAFGNKIEIGDYDSDAKLQKINADPNKFQISIVLGLIEHVSVIILAIMLFIVFSSYNITLGIVWITFRTGEALIYIYNEINYSKLLNIARQYSVTSGAEKQSLSDLGRIILQTKHYRYTFAAISFSIGTLAYSILFVTYGVIPPIIGWLGIVASISFGFGSGIKLVKPNYKGLIVLLAIGGLLVALFEAIIGGWLLFFGII